MSSVPFQTSTLRRPAASDLPGSHGLVFLVLRRGLGGLALCAFAVLISRRLAGGLAVPLIGAWPLMMGVSLAIGGLLVRRWLVPRTRSTASRGATAGPPRRVDDLPSSADAVRGITLRGTASALRTSTWLLLPTLAAGTAAWALLLPGTSLPGAIMLCGPVVFAEACALTLGVLEALEPRPNGLAIGSLAPRRTTPFERESPRFPAGLTQQISRARMPDGRDCCRGLVRTVFASGQRTEIVHLAFCPPFAATPDWVAEPLDGPRLKVKVAQLLPYGVRLELRLDDVPREPVTATIRFRATGAC